MFFKKSTFILILAMLCTPMARAGDEWMYVLGGALVGAGLHELHHDNQDGWRDNRHGLYHHHRYYDDDFPGQYYREPIYYPRRHYVVHERRIIYFRGGYQSSPRYHEYRHYHHHD